MNNDINLIIRDRRINSGYTQKDISEKSGVPLSSIRIFEQSGKISLESFMKIVNVFNLSSKINEILTLRTTIKTNKYGKPVICSAANGRKRAYKKKHGNL